MKSFSRGILALIIASAILLFSDLQNRNRQNGNSLLKGVKFKLALAQYIDSPMSEECENGIRKALNDKNLKEGFDFTLKIYNAQGDLATMNSIAGLLGSENWDLIFASSTPTVQMLVKKLPDSKIVFSNVGDPRAAGLGKSFTNHIPHVSGISTMSDFEGLIRLVKVLHPQIKRIGTVYTPGEINSVSYKTHLDEAAQKAGIELISVPANSVTEVLDAANSLVSQRIEAFCQITDNLISSCISAILKISVASKIPLYGFSSGLVSQGAVAVCARDYFQAGYEAGEMGIEVLSGRDPSQIPFQYVNKTDFILNPKNAEFFKIDIPEALFKAFPTMKIDKK